MATPVPCRYAELLGVITGVPEESILERWGIQLRRCRCGKRISPRSRWCSEECRREDRKVTLICDYCGKTFQRAIHDVLEYRAPSLRKERNRVGFFCCRRCFGLWLAKYHGFGIFPEHAARGRQRKYDWERVLELRRKTGWGEFRIARALGWSRSTVRHILKKGQIHEAPYHQHQHLQAHPPGH